MLGQQAEVVDRVVVEAQLLVVDGEGLLVDHVDLPDPAVQLGIADAALGVPADLPGEQHVPGVIGVPSPQVASGRMV